LENTGAGQNPTPDGKQPENDRGTGFIDKIKGKLHERKAKKEQENPVDRAARLTAKATVWIAMFTVVMALVGLGTLYEIIEGGSDTHDLAVAAGKQADKMRDMSDAADKIRQAAEGMVAQEQRVADSAQASIQATRDAMRLEQRAWVVVKAIGPAPEADKAWNLRVIFTNTGRTPAKFSNSCGVGPATNEKAIDWQVLKPFQGEGTLIVPNDQGFCTLHPVKGTLTKEMADYLASPEAHLYVFGAGIYQDIFRRWHWLTFCSSMTEGGKEWEACDNGNNTGDGKVPPPPFDKVVKPN
jgi:hypothetical protein